MKRTLGIVLLGAVLLVCSGVVAGAATHRYIYAPLVNYLIDLEDPAQTALIDYPTIAAALTSLDLGFTYLEGPQLPSDWLDSPTNFFAALKNMKRRDYAVHTQGVNIVYKNETFWIGLQPVPSLVYPPQFSDPEDLHNTRLYGYFYWAFIYAGFDPQQYNILQSFSRVNNWPPANQQGERPGYVPGRTEVVFRKNFKPYKVRTYDPLEDPDGSIGRAFSLEVIEEILANASDIEDFVVDTRSENRRTEECPPYPSGKPYANFWTRTTGRFHKCKLLLEEDSPWAQLTEPRLSRFPVRDPSTEICPNDPYIWYMPRILQPLHDMLANDNGERCFDVDTWVELDTGMWWNPFVDPDTGQGQFIQVLQPPFSNNDATARAWIFLHVAMNNGHRLIDTANPLDDEGNQVISIIDVPAFGPQYPATFDGGPKIHGYHKRLISPSVSELYRRFKYILTATGATQTARMLAFRNNLGTIISDVHIRVLDPTNPAVKRELTVAQFFQMIADRWDAAKTYGLFPPKFLWLDIPDRDFGQGPPLVFEITCMFDTDPAMSGQYVPMRIIGEAHEGYYITNYYGDPFYAVLNGLGMTFGK